MHPRTGRVTSLTKPPHILPTQHIILTAPRSPQPHPHPPTRYSQSMLHLLRAPTPPTSGQALRIARRGSRTPTPLATILHSKSKKSTSRRTISVLPAKSSSMPRSWRPSPDSTQGALCVSTHTNLKMDRRQLRAPGRHHHWCDKVNEKITSLTVLLVS